MEKTSLPLSLMHKGAHYMGWATPSDAHHTDGSPKSYHVVLNEVFFGDMSYDHGKWVISEQRPHDLVTAVGEELPKTTPDSPAETPVPGAPPEIKPDYKPETPLMPEEDPGVGPPKMPDNPWPEKEPAAPAPPPQPSA